MNNIQYSNYKSCNQLSAVNFGYWILKIGYCIFFNLVNVSMWLKNNFTFNKTIPP